MEAELRIYPGTLSLELQHGLESGEWLRESGGARILKTGLGDGSIYVCDE